MEDVYSESKGAGRVVFRSTINDFQPDRREYRFFSGFKVSLISLLNLIQRLKLSRIPNPEAL
jgi:hypothetical protein